MRVEVENTRSEQFAHTALNQPTPQEIISEKVVKPKHQDVKRNQESFRTRKPNDITEQNTKTSTHSYQSNRPQHRSQNNNSYTTSKPSDTHMSPPLPNYPPPVRPPPPEDYTIDNNKMQKCNNVFNNVGSKEGVTTMRVEVENTRSEQFTQTALNQPTPQEIISEKSC